MGDAGVIADVDARGRKPTRQAVEIFEADGIFQGFLRAGAPFHGHIQMGRKLAETFERPVFAGAAGERVDYGEIFAWRFRDRDAGDPIGRERQRGEKREGQVTDGIAELGTIGSVPGINRIERFELRDPRAVDDAEEIQTGVGDRASAAGKSDQRQDRARSPDFGVIRTGGLESGQGEDTIADRSRTDE